MATNSPQEQAAQLRAQQRQSAQNRQSVSASTNYSPVNADAMRTIPDAQNREMDVNEKRQEWARNRAQARAQAPQFAEKPPEAKQQSSATPIIPTFVQRFVPQATNIESAMQFNKSVGNMTSHFGWLTFKFLAWDPFSFMAATAVAWFQFFWGLCGGIGSKSFAGSRFIPPPMTLETDHPIDQLATMGDILYLGLNALIWVVLLLVTLSILTLLYLIVEFTNDPAAMLEGAFSGLFS